MARAASHRHDPPELPQEHIPSLQPGTFTFNRSGVRHVDRIAIDEFGIPGIVLMENAAQGAAKIALDMLASVHASRRIPHVNIVCGSGNNGGDGYALARLLHNAGCDVVIHPLGSPRPGSDAATNHTICQRMQLTMQPITSPEPWPESDLIVDAIFGTGLDRAIEGEIATIIDWINSAQRPVLAVDLPSGMDGDTGKPLGPCVKATRTVTFVGLKIGFESLDAQKLLGEVTVVDIGVPRELVRRLAVQTTRSPSQTPGRG